MPLFALASTVDRNQRASSVALGLRNMDDTSRSRKWRVQQVMIQYGRIELEVVASITEMVAVRLRIAAERSREAVLRKGSAGH